MRTTANWRREQRAIFMRVRLHDGLKKLVGAGEGKDQVSGRDASVCKMTVLNAS
jgi:hypothetical protein